MIDEEVLVRAGIYRIESCLTVVEMSSYRIKVLQLNILSDLQSVHQSVQETRLEVFYKGMRLLAAVDMENAASTHGIADRGHVKSSVSGYRILVSRTYILERR